MTNPPSGPSLLQARGSGSHPHSLIHRRHHDSTQTQHHHRHIRRRQSPTGTHNHETAKPPQTRPGARVEEPWPADASFLGAPDGAVAPTEASIDAERGLDRPREAELARHVSPGSPDPSTLLDSRGIIPASGPLNAVAAALDNPVALPDNPAPLPENPAGSPESPMALPERPVAALEKPVVAALEKPLVAALEKPVVAALEKPVAALDKPVAELEKSVDTLERPVAALDKPVNAPDKPVNAAPSTLRAAAAIPAAALDPDDASGASPSTASSTDVATPDTSPTPVPPAVEPTAANQTTTSISPSSQANNSTTQKISSSSKATTSGPAPSSSTPSLPPVAELRNNGTNTISNNSSSLAVASLASSTSSPTVLLPLQSPPTSSSSRSSRHRPSTPSSPTTLSFKTSLIDRVYSTTHPTATSRSDELSLDSASDSNPSLSDATWSLSDIVSEATAAPAPVPAPAAGGNRPPTSKGSNADAGGSPISEHQKRRIISSVCGSVAGVAFLAVLVLLAFKYKKRRDGRTLLGGGRLGSKASATLTGGDSMAMTERTASSIVGPFSSFNRKRDSHQAADSVEEGGQRGFYRVAGRKLAPVLITGGDGYSDPRESVMSDGSDYNRGSHTFDLSASGGPRQLALGAPMRPMSGVPIMRSGPARTPVTENPFVDPATQDTPDRRPASRASASKFHERL